MNKVYLATINFESETTIKRGRNNVELVVKVDYENIITSKTEMTQEMFSEWLDKEAIKDVPLKDFDFEKASVVFEVNEYIDAYIRDLLDYDNMTAGCKEHNIEVIMIDDKIYKL